MTTTDMLHQHSATQQLGYCFTVHAQSTRSKLILKLIRMPVRMLCFVKTRKSTKALQRLCFLLLLFLGPKHLSDSRVEFVHVVGRLLTPDS
jgi:hypothetical protein